VPRYTYGNALDHLYTYSQLKSKGLKPRDLCERVGCIVTTFHDVVSLYDTRSTAWFDSFSGLYLL